ncbi:MAG: T9SS type A sorting domain-containing protein [FCB group bacterium]|nr:T9SS type A sorting domain-containing protein [FCB group bacterium]
MRRFIILLLVCLTWGLMAGTATGQVVDSTDTIGFKDTVGVQGTEIWLPIYITLDSLLSGASMNFKFDTTILNPGIIYDDLFVEGLNDSTDWVWYMDVRLSPVAQSYLGSDIVVLVPYSMSTPSKMNTGRFLMYPFGDEVLTLPGKDVVGSDFVLAEILFIVDPDAMTNSSGILNVYIGGGPEEDYWTTELAEEWDNPLLAPLPFDSLDTVWDCNDPPACDDTTINRVDTIHVIPNTVVTRSVIPFMENAFFTVREPDTSGVDPDPDPDPDENKLPVLSLSPTTTIYNIKQGELVSINVAATDVEGGVVEIYANGGDLSGIPNSSLYPSNPITGGGGSATGTFSFTPDVNQQGNFVFSFYARDDSSANSATQTITVAVEELDLDILYTTSAEGQSPEGGIPGLNEVLVPINIVTKKTVYGIQFNMVYDSDNFELDSIVPTDRIPDWIAVENITTTPGELRVVTFGLANDPMVTGTTSAVMYLAFTVDDYAVPGCSPLVLLDAMQSIDPNPDVQGLVMEVESGTVCIDLVGDLNLNFEIDVDDMTGTVGYLIGDIDLSRRRFHIADIVPNDTVNVVDLMGIINTFFGWPIAPKTQNTLDSYLDEYATLNIRHDEIPSAGITSEMAIEADLPTEAAGVELVIRYNPNAVEMLAPELTESSTNFDLRVRDNGEGYMKVLMVNWQPWNEDKLIAGGLSNIIKLPFVSKSSISASDNSQVRITQAFISTGSAKGITVEGVNPGPPLPSTFELYQNRPNPFNPVTTIDFYIDGSSSAADQVKLEIFNIIGQSVKTLIDETLLPGQHSIEWDGTDNNGSRLASGVYLYRLKIGESSQAKKMMLLK